MKYLFSSITPVLLHICTDVVVSTNLCMHVYANMHASMYVDMFVCTST